MPTLTDIPWGVFRQRGHLTPGAARCRRATGPGPNPDARRSVAARLPPRVRRRSAGCRPRPSSTSESADCLSGTPAGWERHGLVFARGAPTLQRVVCCQCAARPGEAEVTRSLLASRSSFAMADAHVSGGGDRGPVRVRQRRQGRVDLSCGGGPGLVGEGRAADVPAHALQPAPPEEVGARPDGLDAPGAPQPPRGPGKPHRRDVRGALDRAGFLLDGAHVRGFTAPALDRLLDEPEWSRPGGTSRRHRITEDRP